MFLLLNSLRVRVVCVIHDVLGREFTLAVFSPSPSPQYRSRFLPVEKIGEEMGWRHLVQKIGQDCGKRLEKGLAKD
jgi:hypothetical protein